MYFLGVSTRFIEGTTYDDGSWGHHNLMKINLYMGFEECISAPNSTEFCLIFQDDTKFHGKFWKHTAALLNGLPDDWTAVHLCPGQLSPVIPDLPEAKRSKKYLGPPVRGRDPRLFETRSDQMTVTLVNDNGTSVTHYDEWPRETNHNNRVIVGMPIAFILRRARARDLYRRIRSPEVEAKKGGADKRLTRGITTLNTETGRDDCFVARQPLLCYHLMGLSSRTHKADVVPFEYD